MFFNTNNSVCRISIYFLSTCTCAGFTLVCVLMAVMKLSSCQHMSSRNELQSIVFVGEINPESSHSCAGFSPVCIHMALKKQSAYSLLWQWKYVCHYSHVCRMSNFWKHPQLCRFPNDDDVILTLFDYYYGIWQSIRGLQA